MIDVRDIPHSKVYEDGTMSIGVPKDVTELPPVFNELTDEVTWSLSISGNKSITEVIGFNNLIEIGLPEIGGSLLIDKNQLLTKVTGFNNLTRVYSISIENNESLTSITGFDSLIEIGRDLWIRNNSKLVAMSIPGSLIRSVDYSTYYGINYNNDLKFKSPPEFINSPVVIDNLVSKLNPGYHSTQVINQIIENLEEWGTEETNYKVVSHLISKGVKYLIPQEFLNKYHSGTIKNNNKIITDYLEMSN